MNRKFDFRALLIKIQDRLSKDDRHRLHFLVGDLIPRMQRDDVTLAGTLTLLESLFDRAAVNEDDLDFLIRIFTEIQFYDAVKLLQEFKSPKELPKEPPRSRKSTLTDVFNDNIEDDKVTSTPYEHLTSVDSTSCSLQVPNARKSTTTETLSIESVTPDINDNLSSNNTPQHIEKLSFKSRMIYCLYVLFFLQMVILLIYLWVFINKKVPINVFEKRYTKDTYFLQNGTLPINITGRWFYDSNDLSLTFADRLIRIDAYAYGDDLYSITFVYSQNKSVTHELKEYYRVRETTAPSLYMEEQDLIEISQCYKNISQPTYLIGLRFQFKKQPRFRGSCSGSITMEDSFPNHIFGFASGRKTKYLTGFQFIWYKICLYHSHITSCDYYPDELNSGFEYTD